MSNAIRFETGEIGFGLDAAAARRQFWLSLGVGLAVLAVAAMIDLQPTRAAPDVQSARHPHVSAPEFVASSAGVALLREAMTAGANSRAD
jgi:hypothetical protein